MDTSNSQSVYSSRVHQHISLVVGVFGRLGVSLKMACRWKLCPFSPPWTCHDIQFLPATRHCCCHDVYCRSTLCCHLLLLLPCVHATAADVNRFPLWPSCGFRTRAAARLLLPPLHFAPPWRCHKSPPSNRPIAFFTAVWVQPTPVPAPRCTTSNPRSTG